MDARPGSGKQCSLEEERVPGVSSASRRLSSPAPPLPDQQRGPDGQLRPESLPSRVLRELCTIGLMRAAQLQDGSLWCMVAPGHIQALQVRGGAWSRRGTYRPCRWGGWHGRPGHIQAMQVRGGGVRGALHVGVGGTRYEEAASLVPLTCRHTSFTWLSCPRCPIGRAGPHLHLSYPCLTPPAP